MGVTHQGHNIPWQVLASVYVEEPEYWNLPGGGKKGTTILKPRQDWPPERVFKAVRHVARRLASAIQVFAHTERQKHATSPSSPDLDVLLYDDQHFDHVLVPGQYQHVPYWLARQGRHVDGRFNFSDGDLADVAKQMLNRGMLGALLRLVHAGVRLDRLAFITYSNFFHYGIRRVLDDGLELYINLNLAVAMGTWRSDHRMWSAQLRRLREEALSGHDYDVHRLPNAAFFLHIEEDNEKARQEGLSAFLSDLFRRLYQYHVVMAECGRFENWEMAALSFVPGHFSPAQELLLHDHMSKLQVISRD